MIKEILKMGGCKTEKEFLQKYPTEESFLEAFPQARPMLEGYSKGGDIEAFPQARPMYVDGGSLEPFPQSVEYPFYPGHSYGPIGVIMNYGGQLPPMQAGGSPQMGNPSQQESPLLTLIGQMVSQYNIDPGQMVALLQKVPQDMLMDLEGIAAQDPNSATQALMEMYNNNRNQPLMENGGPMIPGQGTMMPQSMFSGNQTDEYGGSVFNYGQRPAIMEKGGSVEMNKQNVFLQDKLQKFVGKLSENAIKGKLEDAEKDMAAYYGYKKGGQKKKLPKHQFELSQVGPRETPNTGGFVDVSMNPSDITAQNVRQANMNYSTGVPNQTYEDTYAGSGNSPENFGQGVLSQDVANAIYSNRTPAGKPYSGPPMANIPADKPAQDNSALRSLPGMAESFDRLQGKEYSFMDDVNKYNEEKDKRAPSINAPGDEITKTYDAPEKSKFRKFTDRVKQNWNSMSGIEKSSMVLMGMNKLTSEKQKQIEKQREGYLEEKLFNPMNWAGKKDSDMGKWDVNTMAFDPNSTSYATNYPAAMYGGQMPMAQSGLEVKMRAGLGFNANQLSWPVMAGEFSEPDFSVNGTLSSIPRENATLEAEKDETTMTDLAGIGIPQLYNIGGKKHSQGGTPLDLPENSFVFSEFMKLKDKEQLAMFGVNKTKRGGVSFADISKKYKLNDYIKQLMDPNSDELTRDTAQANIVNANLKLGKLALIQESTKNFPDGIPMISMPYLESVGISPDQLAMAMPDASGRTSMAEEEEPAGDNTARFGANVISKMNTKKNGGPLPIHQTKGPTTSPTKADQYYTRWPYPQKNYDPNDINDFYGLESTDFMDPSKPELFAFGRNFINAMEQAGDITAITTPKYFTDKDNVRRIKWTFMDPATGKESQNFDLNRDGKLDDKEVNAMKDTLVTSLKKTADLYNETDLPGWNFSIFDNPNPTRPSGVNNQSRLYNMADALENRIEDVQHNFELYKIDRENQKNYESAVSKLANVTKQLSDYEAKHGNDLSTDVLVTLKSYRDQVTALKQYINKAKDHVKGGSSYGKPVNGSLPSGSSTGNVPAFEGTINGDLQQYNPQSYRLRSFEENYPEIEAGIKRFNTGPSSVATGNSGSDTTTPVVKQTEEEFRKENEQSINDWAVMIKNNRKKIDDVPSNLRVHVQNVLNNKTSPATTTGPAPTPSDSTKTNTTPVVKDKAKTNRSNKGSSSGSSTVDYTPEELELINKIKEQQQGVDVTGMQQKFMFGGSLEKFLKKHQTTGPTGGGGFNIFVPQAQVTDTKGYTELRAKDAQGNIFDPKKFGTQKYDANLGYYTVYDKTTGKYVPLNLDDFYKRQEGLLKSYDGTGGKGIDAFKKDFLSKDKTTRETAVGWFQDEYNKLRERLKLTPYFGDWAAGTDPYGVDKKFGVFTYSAPGYYEKPAGSTIPEPTPSDCYCTDPDGVKRKREKIKNDKGEMVCPPCEEPDIKKNKEGVKPGFEEPARFWTEDVVNTTAAYMNLGDIKKYLPWQAVAPFDAAEPTFESPERAIAAVNEALAIGAQGAGAFGSPQGYAAAFSSMAGDASQNIANILADVNNRNVQTANQFEMQNTAAYNQYMQQQAANATNMYDKWTIANQQYDNSKREARDELRNQFVNAWKNRGMTQTMNKMYSDQYYTDPRTGYTYMTNPREFEYSEPTYDNMPDYLKKIYDQATAAGDYKTALSAYETWKEIVNNKNTKDNRSTYMANQRNIRGVTDDQTES